jgi:hypothetical protein
VRDRVEAGPPLPTPPFARARGFTDYSQVDRARDSYVEAKMATSGSRVARVARVTRIQSLRFRV